MALFFTSAPAADKGNAELQVTVPVFAPTSAFSQNSSVKVPPTFTGLLKPSEIFTRSISLTPLPKNHRERPPLREAVAGQLRARKAGRQKACIGGIIEG